MAPNVNLTAHSQSKEASPDASPCLPVIDLSELDGTQHDQVVETIVKAAENFGFFQVVNHGIPLELLQELKDSVYRFFDQTEEEKGAYIPKEGSPTPSSATYVKGSGSSDLVDLLGMIYTNEHDALQYWPDSCKEVTLKYHKASGKLVERILRILLSNLGVTLDGTMVDSYMGDSFVTMNHYATYPKNDEVSVVRKHTDSYTLTVLLQDHIGGLFGQLSKNGDMENNYSGECVEIKPIHGALVIFVGDSLQVLSNGRYPAVEHYVQRTGRVRRISVPAFFLPRLTTMIGPLPKAVEKDGGRPRYKEFMFGEYKEKVYNNYEVKSPAEKPIHAFEILEKE